MSLRIRSYDPADQAAVEVFFEVAWRGTPFPFDPIKAHADLRRIREEYQSNGGGFWLLCRDRQVVGTVGIRRLSHDVAELKRLNVLSEHRGRGLGERLFRHGLRHAQEEGFGSVRLDTIRRPGPAMHLFEKYGFLETGRYNSNPDADVFLELQFENFEDEQRAPTART